MPQFSSELLVLTESLEVATLNCNESEGFITDDSDTLPAFCQSLESVLRQGLKVGGLGMMGLVHRDFWNCIEGMTTSSRVIIRPPPSVNHVITVVKQCKKVTTATGRGRLFIRVALTKGVLVQALEALLDNQDYVCYWYRDASVLVDFRRKGVVMDILKSLKKNMYKLNVNNCSFLDETWLIPRIETHEFIPCETLGLTLFAESGKAVIVDVLLGSAAEERGIEPGDCLEELNGQFIDEKLAFRVAQLKKKYHGKPLTTLIAKGRFTGGRWFPPLYSRFQSLCAAGKCKLYNKSITGKYIDDKTDDTDHDKITSQHLFSLNYLGFSNVGTNGSCVFVQDGINKLMKSDFIEKTPVKLELMERDIVIYRIQPKAVLFRFSYTETSSCAIKDDNPKLFGFITGNTTCSFADSFNCHVFSVDDHLVSRQIIDGIGKGFDRTVYCV